VEVVVLSNFRFFSFPTVGSILHGLINKMASRYFMKINTKTPLVALQFME
jgi:hypothetical protein